MDKIITPELLNAKMNRRNLLIASAMIATEYVLTNYVLANTDYSSSSNKNELETIIKRLKEKTLADYSLVDAEFEYIDKFVALGVADEAFKEAFNKYPNLAISDVKKKANITGKEFSERKIAKLAYIEKSKQAKELTESLYEKKIPIEFESNGIIRSANALRQEFENLGYAYIRAPIGLELSDIANKKLVAYNKTTKDYNFFLKHLESLSFGNIIENTGSLVTYNELIPFYKEKELKIPNPITTIDGKTYRRV